MQQKDGVVHVTCGVAMRSTEREVVEIELGKRFAGAEAEVMRDVETVFDGPFGGGRGGLGSSGGGGGGLGDGGDGGEQSGDGKGGEAHQDVLIEEQ